MPNSVHRSVTGKILLAQLLLSLAISTPNLSASELANDAQKSPPADKSQYNLFNPTPSTLLREMVTDRPDKTESPYTVDAGHFQVELDVFTYSRDHDKSGGANMVINSYALAPINIKVGLANSVDLQVIAETWNWVETKDRLAGTLTRQSGFGDLIPRLKFNFWGNDGGPTAMGLMPFVKIPSNQHSLGNSSVEGGIILPISMDLPMGFSLGMMSEYDFNRNDGHEGYHPEFVNSVTLGHQIAGKLEGYIEFFSQVSAEDNVPWIGSLDMGLAYALTPNVRIDSGVNIGVTRSAEDWNPFLGLSVRF